MLKDSETSAFLVSGRKGVGKPRIMRLVIEEAKHENPRLFDVIAGVRAFGVEVIGETMKMRIEDELNKLKLKKENINWRPEVEKVMEDPRATRMLDLQASIARESRIDALAYYKHSSMRTRISTALENKRFLLIVEDVWEFINLNKIGVPTASNGSKIVITSRNGQGPAYVERLEQGKDAEELKEEEVWTLFRDESIDAVANLPKYSSFLGGDTVLECFYYALLFPLEEGADGDRLIEYWRSEGFMDGLPQHSQPEEKEMTMKIVELGNALLKELAERCMLLVIPRTTQSLGIEELVEIDSLEGSSSYHVKVESHIREMIDSRRYLVRFDSSFKEASEALYLKRISLLENDADILIQGPDSFRLKCPELSTLFLHGSSQLRAIPNSFFQFTPKLRVLHLSHLPMNSLFSLISCLQNLRLLELIYCGDLEALPSFSEAWEKLEVLDLNGAPLRKMEETSFQNMQCRRRLDISSALNPTRLSFSGCLSLRMFRIGSQPNLQVLNLPGTVIKQFPSEMSTLEQLRCLYSSDTKTRGGHFRHVFAQTKHIPPPSYQNHLEISGGNNFPYSIDGGLFAKESFIFTTKASFQQFPA